MFIDTDIVAIAEALPFVIVQQKVAELIKGKVLVGHCLWNDLSGTWYEIGAGYHLV